MVNLEYAFQSNCAFRLTFHMLPTLGDAQITCVV